MAKKRILILFAILGFAAVFAAGGWLAGKRIESPADAAARAAAPAPSPILVPVEKRVLSSNIVTRGTARFGLPQPISIAPSALKTDTGLIATLPLPNTQFKEGSVMLTASGRPVFVLQGKAPAYRDLVRGISGDDVLQLEQGLERLGFAPGLIDGVYDARTSVAVAKWYQSAGWEPFGPTKDQLAKMRTLKRDWGNARKRALAAEAAAANAGLAVDTARATAELNNRAAAAELDARMAEQRKLKVSQNEGSNRSVEAARTIADHNNKAAAAEVATQTSARALIALDPRQTEAARKAADAKLELAKSAARKTKLEGELAIQKAEQSAQATERSAQTIERAIKSARAAVEAARLEGEMSVQTALDALKVAQLDAKLAAGDAYRLHADLKSAKRKLGTQVPADEIVFIPALPIRGHEITAVVGDPARGTLMSVTDNQLAIDSSLPLDAALLVKPGMRVTIDEQALGVKASGIVKRVASTPGTHGVDGYHIYFEVRVDETSTKLEGFSLRLTIPIKSTGESVTVVPISALSLAADGTSRVQAEKNGALEYIVVEPGMSADGYVEVTPVKGTIAPGQLVVVGYKNPENNTRQ